MSFIMYPMPFIEINFDNSKRFITFGKILRAIVDKVKGQESNSLMETLQRVFGNERTRTVLFWGMLLAFVLLIDETMDSPIAKILSAALVLFLFWFAVRVNYQYLIPRFLNESRLAMYGLSIVILSAILAPVRALLLSIIVGIFGRSSNLDFAGVMSMFSTFLIILVISAGLKIFSDWLSYVQLKSEMDKQNMQSELKFLRSQVNPHFLFNTLNSLYALTLKKSDLAPEIVIKLSEMMRYMLYECNEPFVPLHKEINYLKNYIELERLRHGRHIDIQLNIHGDVQQQRIAPLLFIPFIENSFKHGISKKIADGFVHIDLHVAPSTVHLDVSNSKAPQAPNPERKKSGGIGLVNVKRRLDLIYPDRHSLEVKDIPNAFTVQLHVELN